MTRDDGDLGDISILLGLLLMMEQAAVMKHIADWALNTATQRGASYADVRIVDDRQRSLATKNGKVGHAASGESLGVGVRVLVSDAWGFAASDNLSREAVER